MEQADQEEEDTSLTENIHNDNADYDNTQSQISSGTVTQSKAETGLGEDDDLTDLEKQIQDHAIKKAIQRYDAIQALESAMDTRFSVTHGDSSALRNLSITYQI